MIMLTSLKCPKIAKAQYSRILCLEFAQKLHHSEDDIFLSYGMPGNIVLGNQSYANKSLTCAAGHDLQADRRVSTNLLSCYLIISQRENMQLGNVVLYSFHFYTRLNRKSWKNKRPCFILNKFIALQTTRCLV